MSFSRASNDAFEKLNKSRANNAKFRCRCCILIDLSTSPRARDCIVGRNESSSYLASVNISADLAGIRTRLNCISPLFFRLFKISQRSVTMAWPAYLFSPRECVRVCVCARIITFEKVFKPWAGAIKMGRGYSTASRGTFAFLWRESG